MPPGRISRHLIKGSIYTYSFFSNLFAMPGPNEDAFATLLSPSLLSPSLRSNLHIIVDSYFRFSTFANDVSFTLLERFSVKKIGLKKASTTIQHESICIWAEDSATSKKHEFIVERVPSDVSESNPRLGLAAFFDSPFHETILESIKKVSSSFAGRLEIAPTAPTAEEVFALLPLADSDEEVAALDFPHPYIPSTGSNLSRSFLDTFTSTLARGMATSRSASRSISAQRLAQDQISGYAPGTLNPESCIFDIDPIGLSLFDIILLAQVVHDQAPLYGLFDNQCYLFASVIFDSVIQLYTVPAFTPRPNPSSLYTSSQPLPIPAPSVKASVPRNANLIIVPDQLLHNNNLGEETETRNLNEAARWCHLLIVDPLVKLTIVGIVISKFREERAYYMRKAGLDDRA
jgi:hypothetical protein